MERWLGFCHALHTEQVAQICGTMSTTLFAAPAARSRAIMRVDEQCHHLRCKRCKALATTCGRSLFNALKHLPRSKLDQSGWTAMSSPTSTAGAGSKIGISGSPSSAGSAGFAGARGASGFALDVGAKIRGADADAEEGAAAVSPELRDPESFSFETAGAL